MLLTAALFCFPTARLFQAEEHTACKITRYPSLQFAPFTGSSKGEFWHYGNCKKKRSREHVSLQKTVEKAASLPAASVPPQGHLYRLAFASILTRSAREWSVVQDVDHVTLSNRGTAAFTNQNMWGIPRSHLLLFSQLE